MASSPISSLDIGATTSNSNHHPRSMATTLPSLFGEHNVNGGHVSAGKELDGLIAMNDSALSQQIEFILQDAPMEHDDEDDVPVDHNNHDRERTAIDIASSTDLGDADLKLENPPTTNVVTSASEYSNSSGGHTSTGDNVAIVTAQDHQQQHQQQHHHLLNGRRIIIQTTEATSGMVPTMSPGEMEDPELNDENLQDIEEEAQAAEAEEEEEQLQAHVKIEQTDDGDMDHHGDNGIEFLNASTSTITHAQLTGGQPPQLVLPAGSIVSTSTRALTVPVSEALAQLQRRPVYISNAVGSMAGATFVRMPAVISRSPMTVLNVVQQGVGGANGPTTQLILQATPVGNAQTPVVVSSSGSGSVSAPIQVAEMAIAAPLSNAATLSETATSTPATVQSSSIAPALSTNSTAQTTTMTTTTYQCVECVEKFESKELFDIHRSGHANNMKCAICNMVLKSLKNYEKHCLRCKPYECQICGRVVRFRPNFIKHMRVHTGQQSERHKYKCDVCHKEFMSFEYFKVHKKIHNENVNLTCEICGKVFSALASLRGHSKLHSGVKLHKCDVCGKGFGQRYNLKIHARTHTGDFPFECKICKKKLHTQSSLQTHMQVHQRDQNAQVSTTTVKYEQTSSSANAAGNTSSSSCGNVSTATIVKIEPNSSRDGPSTSGLQHQHLLHDENDDEMDDNSALSDGDNPIVSTSLQKSHDDSNSVSSNGSQELHSQQLLLSHTPTRTIVFKNYIHDDHNAAGGSNAAVIAHQQKVIHAIGSSSNNGVTLQQQMLRKTPIIHSTGGATTLSSALASVVQQTGISPSSPSPSSSSTSCSSSVAISKTGAPLSLASAAIGTSTIRSTRNPHHLGSNLNNQHHHHQQQQQNNHHHRSSLQRNSNHRNHHHRRPHPNDMDDDDEEDEHHHRLNLHHHTVNGRHFDDDDDDEKSSPSLATAAIIKVEPNLYSSGSGDNSNEMLIKEEVMFEDSAAPHSPHSPPSSKYRMSNFDNDLVDHHVDLNHSLPPYGNLFEPHSIPDSIPVQLYPDDDDDFRLDHSSLGGLHNTSSSTTDGDFIKKEWVYGAGSSYAMNGKFDDDSDALCDAANFIYN